MHFGENEKVGLGNAGAHFFSPIVNVHACKQSISQNQIDRSNFFATTYLHPSVPTYLLRTIMAMASPCDPGEMRDNRALRLGMKQAINHKCGIKSH